MIPKINSAHGSETRNIINEIIKAINDRGLEILSDSAFLNWLEENGVKHRGEWSSTEEYDRQSVVLHEGNSYTSKKHVPAGIDILNEEFWIMTGNYNAQIESYRMETERVSGELTEKSDKTYVDSIKNDVNTQFLQHNEYLSQIAINLKQPPYNLKGNNIDDDSVALQNAIDSIPEGSVILLPRSTYILKNTITINKPMTILGATAGEDGRTVLKFYLDDKPNDTSAIQLVDGAKHVHIKDVYIRNYGDTVGNRHGINTEGVTGWITNLRLYNVWCVGFNNGFRLARTYLSSFRDCTAAHNTIGFNILGFSTSLLFEGCYANTNSAVGYELNNTTYSSLNSCACDSSDIGYRLDNCRGVKLVGSGAEFNGHTAIHVRDSNNGVSVDSCFGHKNAGANQGFGSFIHVENTNKNIGVMFNNEETVHDDSDRNNSIVFGSNATGAIDSNNVVNGVFHSSGVTFNGQYTSNTEPTTGTHHAGKVVWNRRAFMNELHQYAGWICVESGSPGVWKKLPAVIS